MSRPMWNTSDTVEFANGQTFTVVEAATDGHALITMNGLFCLAFLDLTNDEDEDICFPHEGEDEWTDEATAVAQFQEAIAA